MSTEQDSFTVRIIKGEIATWTSRVEMAKRLGDPQLLQKALKYKTKYEKQLAELLELLAECEERDRLQMLNPHHPEEHGCPSCSMFSTFPDYQLPEDDLTALTGSSEFMREIMRAVFAAMGRPTNAEMQDMEAVAVACRNLSTTCDKCRIEWNKRLAMWQLIRDAAQTES
ncbi:MAG: hypothetical protein HYX67_07770 [Candidatus Melainabacteria bacterium]|nr:hypothetical protein [Candidatus Melainabacteria bacterium]